MPGARAAGTSTKETRTDMADLNAIVDQLSTLTVMEAADLVKKLEEKWGVSAAAAPVMMAARRRRCCGPGRGEDGVHGRPDRGRREQDQRHQGSPRHHRPRPEGGEGPRRGRPQGSEGGHPEDRGRRAQEEARGRRRQGRGEVARSSGVGGVGWSCPAAPNFVIFDRVRGSRYNPTPHQHMTQRTRPSTAGGEAARRPESRLEPFLAGPVAQGREDRSRWR